MNDDITFQEFCADYFILGEDYNLFRAYVSKTYGFAHKTPLSGWRRILRACETEVLLRDEV